MISLRNSLFLSAAALLLAGCQSNRPVVAKDAASKPTTGVYHEGVYYEFNQSPGSADFLSEAVYDRFQMTGGTRVVVVNGQFPAPEAMPRTLNLLSEPEPAAIPLDCIDTEHPLPGDLK